MMPSFLRFRARLVTFVVITLSTLNLTIAKPFETSEGETSITNGFSHPTMRMMGPEMSIGPYMFMRNPFPQHPQVYDAASNVQINYNDDKSQEDTSLVDDETSRRKEALSRRSSLNSNRRFHLNVNSNDENRVSDDEDDRILDEMLGKIERLEKKLKKNNAYPSPHLIEVETRTLNDQPKTIELDKNIELVTPKHVFIPPLEDDFRSMPPAFQYANLLMRKSQTDDSDERVYQNNNREKNEKIADKRSFQDEEPSSLSDEDENIVPVQDVGEQEVEGESDDEMEAENSQNIAYSYSHFQPNYHSAPNSIPGNERLVDHEVPPLSFIFHPTVLRGMQPNVVLHELKSFALQLDESPIMNALFSPSTVPIPPTQPAWPSKYEAQKYLPPNLSLKEVPESLLHQPEFRKSLNLNAGFLDPRQLANLEGLGNLHEGSIHPFLRRSMVRIESKNLSPELREKLNKAGRVPPNTISTIIQNSMAQNAEAFNDFMQKSFTFPQTVQVSQAFERGSNAMNDFFHNQLRLPQFPTFPSYANQFHVQNNRLYSQSQNPPNQVFFPQLQTLPNPYISPSLREMVNSADDIDVRIDARPDSEIDKTLKTDLQSNGSQVVQLGDGNMNYDGQSVVQMSDDVENEIKRTLTMDDLKKPEVTETGTNANDDEVGNDNLPDAEVLKNAQSDVTRDPAKYDMVKADAEEKILDEVFDYLMTEEPVKVMTLSDSKQTINPELSDEFPVNDDSLTTIGTLFDENAVTGVNDVEQTTMFGDEVETTTKTLADEDEVTTESLSNDEVTTEPSQDEMTTQFDLADPSSIASLSG